jgi:hypothetical protein
LARRAAPAWGALKSSSAAASSASGWAFLDAAEDCPRRLRAQAEEELERLKDKAYRNEAMWTIPYRLLPLALTLPAIGCRIEGRTRRDGRAIRYINC